MFQKSQRLRNNEEILKTIKKGVNLKTPFFNVKYLKIDKNFKITVIVSKKISKLAVERNRLKRIFRAEIKNFINREKIKEDGINNLKGNFVFFPFENSLKKKSSDLEKFIEQIFEQIKK